MKKLLVATLLIGLSFFAFAANSDAGVFPSFKRNDAYFRPSILDYHLFRVNAQRFAPTGHQHYIPSKRNRGHEVYGPGSQPGSANCKYPNGKLTKERHMHGTGSSENAVYPAWRGYKHRIHPKFTHDHPQYQTAPHVDYDVYRYSPVPPRQYYGESSFDDKPEFIMP